MSKDVPIIFSRPMVRALLEGRKTQTRRIIKLPTKGEYVRPDMGGWAATTVGGGNSFVVRRDGTREPARETVAIWNQTTGTCIAMNYHPGDRLWVREAVARIDNSEFGEASYWQYRADTNGTDFAGDWPPETKDDPERPRWKPSIHMPREASRMTLPIDTVKVERLQDISDDDCIAEGVCAFTSGSTSMFGIKVEGGYEHPGLTPRETFMNLWCAINGPSAWNDNPFVVAPTFRVIKANIDAPEARAA